MRFVEAMNPVLIEHAAIPLRLILGAVEIQIIERSARNRTRLRRARSCRKACTTRSGRPGSAERPGPAWRACEMQRPWGIRPARTLERAKFAWPLSRFSRFLFNRAASKSDVRSSRQRGGNGRCKRLRSRRMTKVKRPRFLRAFSSCCAGAQCGLYTAISLGFERRLEA